MGFFRRVRASIAERFQATDVIARLVPLFRTGKALPSPHDVLALARLGYVKNPIVGACISALARSASEPELEVVRPVKDELEPVPDTHPAAELLEHPNREQSQYEFLNEFLTHYRVSGNAFVHKRRNPRGRVVELWNLRPDRMAPVPGSDGIVETYEYSLSNTRKVPIPALDVIHMKEPNPLDDYWGLSRIVQVAMYVDLDNEAAEWLRDFFENKGVVAAILRLKQKTNREQRRETKEEWLDEYGMGSNRRHGLAVLGHDAEYQKIAETPSKELDLEPLTGWRNTFVKACQKAGRSNYTHDCRRTAARALRRAGVPRHVAMKLIGHKTREMYDRYDIIDESDLDDALLKLEQYVSSLGEIPTERVVSLGK